jgi:hypothetical protein
MGIVNSIIETIINPILLAIQNLFRESISQLFKAYNGFYSAISTGDASYIGEAITLTFSALLKLLAPIMMIGMALSIALSTINAIVLVMSGGASALLNGVVEAIIPMIIAIVLGALASQTTGPSHTILSVLSGDFTPILNSLFSWLLNAVSQSTETSSVMASGPAISSQDNTYGNLALAVLSLTMVGIVMTIFSDWKFIKGRVQEYDDTISGLKVSMQKENLPTWDKNKIEGRVNDLQQRKQPWVDAQTNLIKSLMTALASISLVFASALVAGSELSFKNEMGIGLDTISILLAGLGLYYYYTSSKQVSALTNKAFGLSTYVGLGLNAACLGISIGWLGLDVQKYLEGD